MREFEDKSFVELHEPTKMREFGGQIFCRAARAGDNERVRGEKSFVEAQINLLNAEIYSSVVFHLVCVVLPSKGGNFMADMQAMVFGKPIGMVS